MSWHASARCFRHRPRRRRWRGPCGRTAAVAARPAPEAWAGEAETHFGEAYERATKMSSDIDEIRLEEARQDYWDALEIEHARKLLGVRNRAPKGVPSGGLLDMAQAAASLGIGVRTLRAHLRAGSIRYVDVGRGKQRRAPRFEKTDLEEFKRTNRGQAWPSTSAGKSTITSSSTAVIDFAALRAAHRGGKPEAVERAKRQEAAKEHEHREALGRAPLTWGVAASRYWTEHGQHHAVDTGTLRVARMVDAPHRRADAARGHHRLARSTRLVAKRRADRRRTRDHQPDHDGAPAQGAQPRPAVGRAPAADRMAQAL